MSKHNQLKEYPYKGFVVRLYYEQYTQWWFYQFYYSKFPIPQLEWSPPFEFEWQAVEIAENYIDEILVSYA